VVFRQSAAPHLTTGTARRLGRLASSDGDVLAAIIIVVVVVAFDGQNFVAFLADFAFNRRNADFIEKL
jgi:hypothetical protein